MEKAYIDPISKKCFYGPIRGKPDRDPLFFTL